MRKILFIGFVTVLISCKESTQYRAETLADHYLDSTLDDPTSYKSVKFSSLTGKGRTFTDSNKPIPCCETWMITDVFRHKNKNGAIVLDTAQFTTDSLITKIINFSTLEHIRSVSKIKMDSLKNTLFVTADSTKMAR